MQGLGSEEGQCSWSEFDCDVSSNNFSEPFSEFSVGPVPCYVGIVSDLLSCLASVVMVSMYIAWRDIRQNGAQAIITFIAIADFLTAFGYMIVDVYLLTYAYSKHKPDRQSCNVFTTVCETQSYLVTCATMSSYFWTIILAVYFYITIVQSRPGFTKKLIPIYHMIAWGLPILIAFPLLCFGKLAYASFVTGIWCYMEIYRNSPPFIKDDTLVSIAIQLPEIIAFLVIIILFMLTWINVHRQARASIARIGLLVTEQARAMYQVTKVGRILLFIPILFVVLRMWAVVQYFYTIYLTNLAQNDGHCIPTDPHKTIHIVLAVLQAIGAGGQGWANAILYIFLSPKIRKRLFCCCCSHQNHPCICKGLCKKKDKTRSTTYFSPSYYESIGTDSILKNWDVL